MRTVMLAGIWIACGLLPSAFLLIGLLPDTDVGLPRLMMPMFMVSLWSWLMAGLVMVVARLGGRLDHRS